MQQPVSPGKQKWKHCRPGVDVVSCLLSSVGVAVVVGGGTQQPVSPGRQMWSHTMPAAATCWARNSEARTADKEDTNENFIVLELSLLEEVERESRGIFRKKLRVLLLDKC